MKSLAQPASFCFAAAFLFSGIAHAQGRPIGFWTAPDANAAHTNWQKAEKQISTDTVTKDFKFLWKLKLGSGRNKIHFLYRAAPVSRPDHRSRIQGHGPPR